MSSSSKQTQILQSLLTAKVETLLGLKDIANTRAWDYSLPTLSNGTFIDRFSFKSDESFFEIFQTEVNHGLPYRILHDAGAFNESNTLVLFGGCLLDILLKRKNQIKDFDLRLVGAEFVDDEEKCIAEAKLFVASIFSTLSKENDKIKEQMDIARREGKDCYLRKCDLQDVTVSRCRSTVTVSIPSFGCMTACCFQLTFSAKRSVHELFAQCYPHCTRLAIIDNVVVLDEMARFCIESACVIMDPSVLVDYQIDVLVRNEDNDDISFQLGRTVTSQIVRFMKYHTEKGFDIILPELDMTKLSRKNLVYDVEEVLVLPCLIVVYNSIRGNIIRTTRLDLPKSLKLRIGGEGIIGEYDSKPMENVGEAIHFNIRCLVHDVYTSFRYVSQGERFNHVFDFVPELTPRMIRKSYETVTESLNKGEIPISRVVGYFTATAPDQVIEKLISHPIKGLCKHGKLPELYALDETLLNEMIEKEVQSLLVKIEGLRDLLKEKGLDKLVVHFPENVSTVEELHEAIYGSNGLRNDQK